MFLKRKFTWTVLRNAYTYRICTSEVANIPPIFPNNNILNIPLYLHVHTCKCIHKYFIVQQKLEVFGCPFKKNMYTKLFP